MIKTVELTGAEIKVEGLDGKNTAIYNKSSAAVYASCTPNVTPDADGVMEIPAGGYRGLNDTRGIVYLLGTGKVELTGTDDSVNFKMPSSSVSSGGDGGETMPCMNGITGYFIPSLCDQTGWKNLLLETDFIQISGKITVDNDVVHFPKTAKGIYKTPEPAVIYAVMASEAPLTNTNLDPLIMKGMTTSAQAYGIFLFGYDNRMLYGAGGGAYDIAMPEEDRALISTLAVYAIVNSNGLGTFWTNAKKARDSRARYHGYYSGDMIINGEQGTNLGISNDNKYALIAFGSLPHNDEQIKANSEWLMNKYLKG